MPVAFPVDPVRLTPAGWEQGGVPLGQWSGGPDLVSSTSGVVAGGDDSMTFGVSEPLTSTALLSAEPLVIRTRAGSDVINGASNSTSYYAYTIQVADIGYNIALSYGVAILPGVELYTEADRDELVGTANAVNSLVAGSSQYSLAGALGILNLGYVDLGPQADVFRGTANASNASVDALSQYGGALAVGAANAGSLLAGTGDDQFSGTAVATNVQFAAQADLNGGLAVGALNVGSLDLGAGANRVVGNATASAASLVGPVSLVGGALAVGVLNANISGFLGIGSQALFNGDGLQGGSINFPGGSGGSGGSGNSRANSLEGTANAAVQSLADISLDQAALAAGIFNSFESVISFQKGSADVRGIATATLSSGLVAAGAVAELQTQQQSIPYALSAGIFNLGEITTASSGDRITGLGQAQYDSGVWPVGSDLVSANGGLDDLSYGIYNEGLIFTGNGADTVDALIGGFGGNGLISLGQGVDTLKGFGDGRFDGGTQRDLLTFNAGAEYTVSSAEVILDGVGFYMITNGNGFDEMYVRNFEAVITNSGVVSFSSVIGQTFTV